MNPFIEGTCVNVILFVLVSLLLLKKQNYNIMEPIVH